MPSFQCHSHSARSITYFYPSQTRPSPSTVLPKAGHPKENAQPHPASGSSHSNMDFIERPGPGHSGKQWKRSISQRPLPAPNPSLPCGTALPELCYQYIW
uniref:Uncharacterized protein n=1 Tax=Knipowitschia caucasica TaxID=637954 RepID=A0AAV2K0L7_KNICA